MIDNELLLKASIPVIVSVAIQVVRFLYRLMLDRDSLPVVGWRRHFNSQDSEELRAYFESKQPRAETKEAMRVLYEGQLVSKQLRRPPHPALVAALLRRDAEQDEPLDWRAVKKAWFRIKVRNGLPEIRIGLHERLMEGTFFFSMIGLMGAVMVSFMYSWLAFVSGEPQHGVIGGITFAFLLIVFVFSTSDVAETVAALRLHREWHGPLPPLWSSLFRALWAKLAYPVDLVASTASRLGRRLPDGFARFLPRSDSHEGTAA